MTAPTDLYELREALMSALDSLGHRVFDNQPSKGELYRMLERELIRVDEKIAAAERKPNAHP